MSFNIQLKFHFFVVSYIEYFYVFVNFDSYFLPDKSRKSKRKTGVQKKTSNPLWNENFTYKHVSLEELETRAIEITIWDYDSSSHQFLGKWKTLCLFLLGVSFSRKIIAGGSLDRETHQHIGQNVHHICDSNNRDHLILKTLRMSRFFSIYLFFLIKCWQVEYDLVYQMGKSHGKTVTNKKSNYGNPWSPISE